MGDVQVACHVGAGDADADADVADSELNAQPSIRSATTSRPEALRRRAIAP
jgi:hypothetical protein